MQMHYFTWINTNKQVRAKLREKKMEILIKKTKPDTSYLVTITVLNTKTTEFKNKIPNNSSLVTTTVLGTKISKFENKFLDHDKYITTPEFNKLTAEKFAARLKQANLVTKTDFDNKLTSFNRKISTNEAKYLETEKKLNILLTKDYNFFLVRIFFISNDGFQNTFVYQPTLDTLESKENWKGIH